MGHERDERWAYVSLAVLAVAYIAYRFAGSSDLGGLSIRLPDLSLGKLAKSLPYLFAPLFAVLSEIIRRGKARAVREMWERNSRLEGFLRGEDKLKIRFVEGGKGSMQGDVRLTRAALYVLDSSARREPLIFPLKRSIGSEPVVLDVTLREGSAPELWRVRVLIEGGGGAGRLAFEFESREGHAWLWSLRRALGKSVDAEPREETPAMSEPARRAAPDSDSAAE